MTQSNIKPLKDLVEPGWANALAEVEPQVHRMGDFLRGEIAAGRRYLPASANILRAFTIPFDSIKVLIVGQDPYPTPGHPVGLSFCVAPDVQPIPRSLTNIYKELTDDLGVPMPTNGDLTPWTNQGVMLLNRCLTVEAGKPGSHQDKGWEIVTDAAIKALNNRRNPDGSIKPLVAILVGAQGADAGTAAHQRIYYRLTSSESYVRAIRILRFKTVLPRQPSAHRRRREAVDWSLPSA